MVVFRVSTVLVFALSALAPACWAQNDLISSLDDTFKNERCEPLDATQVATCRDVGYNSTLLPNRLGHNTQKDAGLIANQYFPLIEVNCYDKLQFFVCAVYLPMCLPDYPQYLPPCRSICLQAKSKCEPLMQQFGFHWPEDLRCDKFPESSTDDQLCAGNDTLPPRPTSRPGLNLIGGTARPIGGIATTDLPATRPPYNKKRIPCGQQHFYRKEDRDTSRYWVGVWATLCFLSSVLVVATYCIDRERFNYPERPVIYLAGCYVMFSFGYLVSLMVGDNIACADGYAVQPDEAGAGCIIVAFLLYFSWMAAALWWVTLAFTWFLAASLKWAPEGIGKHFFKYHVFSWGVAIVQTVLLMALKKVDADELTGACFVGYFDDKSLAGFVIGPLCVYLIIGALLFLYGFMSLVNIRSVIRQSAGGHRTDKLEKLMVRVAVFSILYAIPTAVVLGCLFVEHSEKPSWKYPMDGSCNAGYPGPAEGSNCDGVPAKPALFMLRLFMVLIVGLASGIWIWSTKTLESWGRRFGRSNSARAQYQATRIRSDSSTGGHNSHVPSAMTSMTGVTPSINTSNSGMPMHQSMHMYPQMQQAQYIPGGY
ncbi:frizzled-2-like [Sycon ciliatum]|uniref:Frizzled D SciFzdD n=1 Tax=Sycon ciliatum TaxID=27933 RepID=A0A077SMV2_9METZ|nr:Frizzled D SciFzdD [Sycon ciliatum]|eukprot:scpid39161/ scgid6445/ Frizzled-5